MKTLLGRLLENESRTTDACLDSNHAAAYIEKGLTREEAHAVDLHLGVCARCRHTVMFAALPERPQVAAEGQIAADGAKAAAPDRFIGVKLAVRNAIGAVEALFEGTLSLAAARMRGEAPVFRGNVPEVEGVNTVVLGPYRLSLKRIEDGPRAGLYVRVTKAQGMPLTDAAAEIELESGKHFSGRTDKLGWVHIAGVAMEHISAIWIDAAA